MKTNCYCSDVLGPRTERQRCFNCPHRAVTVELAHGTVQVVECDALPENAPFIVVDQRRAPLAPGVHRCPCGCDGAFGGCLR